MLETINDKTMPVRSKSGEESNFLSKKRPANAKAISGIVIVYPNLKTRPIACRNIDFI